MLHPSYTDLIEAVNKSSDAGENPVVQSRYSIVIAAAKRARQIVNGSEPMVHIKNNKPLSTAVQELYAQKVSILSDDSVDPAEEEVVEEVIEEEIAAEETIEE